MKSDPSTLKHWEVILAELIHLVGLFLVHSRHARGLRTTDVFFDQLVRHMGILMRMPGHDGGILIRRTHRNTSAEQKDANYVVSCGSLLVGVAQERGENLKSPARRSVHLNGLLIRAFQCFFDQRIYSLYIKMPGESAKRIDQLRLALNIVARYRTAVSDATSIRFRCYGRAMTFALIYDSRGKPDPNLTLMAAINGLSPVNARELIKQAAAFSKMSGDDEGKDEAGYVSSYNQIFSVRSLRSQVVRPPIEVNNLPWLEMYDHPIDNVACTPEPTTSASAQLSRPAVGVDFQKGKIQPQKMFNEVQGDSPQELRTLASRFVDIEDEKNRKAMDALTADDYGALAPVDIGERLSAVTRLLYALDKRCQDPSVMARIIESYQYRLKNIQEPVLSRIVAQNQALKIVSDGRTVVVGLVHPRLFDLITFMSERVAAKRRSGIIKKIAFNFDACHIPQLSDGFGIAPEEAHHILNVLRGCFSANGNFIRRSFEGRIEVIAQYENTIFEFLWCFLKETPRSRDRVDFLNAIQLLMARLKNPKQAVQFLLADLFQEPYEIAFTDRNALCLANILLHRENKELYIDINRTPEDVLGKQRRINKEVRRYSAWRLNMDSPRVLSKFRTINQMLIESLIFPEKNKGYFEPPFLLALEREALIFLGIIGGHSARVFLRDILSYYADPEAEVYCHRTSEKHISEIMAQLQIIVRALGRAGNADDVRLLKKLQDKDKKLRDLDPHPAHTLRVKQLMKWVPESINMIYTMS